MFVDHVTLPGGHQIPIHRQAREILDADAFPTAEG